MDFSPLDNVLSSFFESVPLYTIYNQVLTHENHRRYYHNGKPYLAILTPFRTDTGNCINIELTTGSFKFLPVNAPKFSMGDLGPDWQKIKYISSHFGDRNFYYNSSLEHIVLKINSSPTSLQFSFKKSIFPDEEDEYPYVSVDEVV